MNQINTNINNYYGLNRADVRFKADPQAVQTVETPDVQLPDTYYMPDPSNRQKSFKETIKKYDVLGLVYNWLAHPFMMLGTCLGISYGIDLFDRACNKPYEESVVGKAAKFGDKIELSEFVQKKETQKALKNIDSGWGKVKNFFMKNSVVRSMVETPSVPEFDMPKDELKNTEYRVVSKFKEIAHSLNINVTEGAKTKSVSLRDLALDDAEKKYIKDFYKVDSLFAIKDSKAIDRINLRRLGKTEAEISSILSSESPTAVVDAIIEASGLTKEEWKQIMEDTEGKTYKLVEKASKNLKGLKTTLGWAKIPGPYQPFANITGFEEVFNRMHSIKVGNGAKTKTGAFMAKLVQKIHRGFTFGGAKFGVLLFVAPALVDMFKNTKKADKKEKVGTVVDGLIRSVSWVFIFPLALKTIHAVGGIQYAGMGKEKVELYRQKINDFNKLVDNGAFSSEESYKKSKKALKEELKKLKEVKNQSLLTRMLRKISAFTKADLEKINSYKNNSTMGNLWRKMPNFLKDASYSPARFFLFMFALMPFYDKIIEKCTSAIFGKPYDGMKEEEYEEEKKNQEEYALKDLQARMLEVQKRKLNSAKSEQVENVPLESKEPIEEQKVEPIKLPQEKEEVIKQAETLKQQTNTIEQQHIDTKIKDNYTYIPSSVNVLKDVANNAQQINKYIPSQVGISINKTFDNSGLDAAIKRASRAEQRALNVLSGNFVA